MQVTLPVERSVPKITATSTGQQGQHLKFLHHPTFVVYLAWSPVRMDNVPLYVPSGFECAVKDMKESCVCINSTALHRLHVTSLRMLQPLTPTPLLHRLSALQPACPPPPPRKARRASLQQPKQGNVEHGAANTQHGTAVQRNCSLRSLCSKLLHTHLSGVQVQGGTCLAFEFRRLDITTHALVHLR